MSYSAVSCLISKYVGNFSDMLLILKLILLWWQIMICMISVLLCLLILVLWPGILFWWIFHVHLNSMYILLLLRIVYKYQVKLVDTVVWGFCILKNFLFYLFYHWERSRKSPSIIMDYLFHFSIQLLIYVIYICIILKYNINTVNQSM